MDSCDEKLTLENVDEQVEQLLSLPQEIEPTAITPLAHTIRNIQNIYEEDRRLEQVWTRVKSHASTLSTDMSALSTDKDSAIKLGKEIPISQLTVGRKKARQTLDGRSLNSILHRPNKQSAQTLHWNWSNIGIGLVAAIILISFVSWSMWSYVLHGSWIASTNPATQTATPQLQATVNLSDMQEYVGQYFKMQYPVDWKMSSVNTKGTNHLQSVQFRPLAASSVEVNVDALPNSNYSNDQLLQMDPDVKLGTLLNTNTITYHGISWTVGIIEISGSTHAQMGKFKVAYSNQGTLSRVEFSTTADMFSSYSKVFDAMLASFYPQATRAVVPTATPSLTPTIPATMPAVTTTPAITATPTPTPAPNIPSIKDYINQYFKIQYPANWVITNVITGDGYLQTVQFRPSTNSPVFVNVSVMNSNDLSSDLLLLADPDVKLGTLLSTNTLTYHGIPWTVGIVNLVSSAQAQPSKVQVAYSNQHAPYKIEFSAPQNTFSSNTTVFNAMFASFYPTN